MKDNKSFIVKEKKRDHEEYVIKKSPVKTVAGKILVILIVLGTILVPVVAMIVALLQK